MLRPYGRFVDENDPVEMVRHHNVLIDRNEREVRCQLFPRLDDISGDRHLLKQRPSLVRTNRDEIGPADA